MSYGTCLATGIASDLAVINNSEHPLVVICQVFYINFSRMEYLQDLQFLYLFMCYML